MTCLETRRREALDATRKARAAVDAYVDAAGAVLVSEANPNLARCWRQANGASDHVAVAEALLRTGGDR